MYDTNSLGFITTKQLKEILNNVLGYYIHCEDELDEVLELQGKKYDETSKIEFEEFTALINKLWGRPLK